MKEKLDFTPYRAFYLMLALGVILWFAGNYLIPLYGERSVATAENLQAILLFVMFLQALYFACKFPSHSDARWFWIWSGLWWLMIFGRSVSWGRDYFPDIPHPLSRTISVILIALPILGFLVPAVRRHIKYHYLTDKFPVWYAFSAFLFLGVADIVEHHRPGHTLLLRFADRQDLLEELFEFPCFFSLILVALYWQRHDRKQATR